MCDGEVSESQAQASLRFPSPRVGISLVFFFAPEKRPEEAKEQKTVIAFSSQVARLLPLPDRYTSPVFSVRAES